MGGEPGSGGVPTEGGERGSGGVSTGGGAAGNGGTSSEGGVPSEGGAAGGGGGGGANEPSLSAISVNLYDSCALFSDASVKCWGTAEAYGTSDQPFHFGYNAPLAAEKPLKIVEMPGVTVEHVATSLFSTCVLLADRSFLSFLFRRSLGLEVPPARPVESHLGGHSDITQNTSFWP